MLVGIDRYSLPGSRVSARELRNDARLMAEVLQERLGLPEEGKELQIDEAALCNGIRAGSRPSAVVLRAARPSSCTTATAGGASTGWWPRATS